jgi:hypothetical protein
LGRDGAFVGAVPYQDGPATGLTENRRTTDRLGFDQGTHGFPVDNLTRSPGFLHDLTAL